MDRGPKRKKGNGQERVHVDAMYMYLRSEGWPFHFEVVGLALFKKYSDIENK